MEIINFENKDIRTLESDGQTWYSVVDVIGAITGASNPNRYWSELVFTTLSETLTREMTERLNAMGFEQNRDVAKEAGEQTGESRKRLEKKTGISVVSKFKWLKKG